jgi:hypothetical chaperone protein
VEGRQGHTIAIAVEQAKIELTTEPATHAALDSLGDWAKFRFTRRDFDEAIAQSIERVVMTVQRLLSDARTRANDINTILLTGGSSMVPALREGILTLFPGARIAESDLLGSVGIGLSLDARSKFA